MKKRRQKRESKFERQLQFNKFCRMIVPYLMQGNCTLFSAFEKTLKRLETGTFKQDLQRLMIDIMNAPDDVAPFVQFAQNSSETDFAVLFMTTLFDYQQSTKDTSVIAELGRISSEELLEVVDEITSYKLRKFAMFPTKLTMASFVLILGYAAAIMADAFAKIAI